MLTQDQKLQFREDGFLLFEELISGDRLARYVAVFDELVERGRKLQEPEPHFSLELETDGSPIPGLLHKVQGVCVVEPRILGLASEPAILDRVGALLAGGLGVIYLRGRARSKTPSEAPLSAEEEARLRDILDR